MGANTHFERAGPFQNLAADTTQSDHPDHLAAQLTTEELLLFPLAGFRRSARLGNEARHRKHECDRMFGDRYRITTGSVHHQHAGGGRGRQIDIVDSDTSAADDPQLRRLLEHVRRDLHRAADNQRISRRQMLRVFLRIGHDDVPAWLGLEQFDTCLRHRLGYKDVHYEVAFLGWAASYTLCTAATPLPSSTVCPLARRINSRPAMIPNMSAKSK